MADDPRHPLLKPVLRLTREPRPESVAGGGKGEPNIKEDRLEHQRQALAEQFRSLSARAAGQPSFDGRVVLYAIMFGDSLAPSYAPSDLFSTARGAWLIAPYRSGYLVEIKADRISEYDEFLQHTRRVRDRVDISRVELVRFFENGDACGTATPDEVWEAAPETGSSKAFVIWLMPLRDSEASEELIRKFAALRGGVIAPPPSLLAEMDADAEAANATRQKLRAVATAGDRIDLAMREYRQRRRARATVLIPSRGALDQLIASGTVFRIEPVQAISSTSPEEGGGTGLPLPKDMTGLPTVGVVDGGLTVAEYLPAEAWRAPPFIDRSIADTTHGNRVTSLVVQGHDLNNNLALPDLYCRIGTVQAVPREGSLAPVNLQDFIAYLDVVMGENRDTRVWNFSLNQLHPCDPETVSAFGHDISLLARKHQVLPVISVGNKGNEPGTRLRPPADCEAAITVGGRMHDQKGNPAGRCPVSLCGPGPSNMLKPDLSHFSHVRAWDGVDIQGSSFSTSLTSSLAAHTMERIRDPSPDLVKALLLHNSDLVAFDPALGFGTPAAAFPPWECRPGFVTLLWPAQLRPGAAYYWELPIPDSLKKTGKLRGTGALTAILNPHPMVTDYAGPNYFSVRLATALQRQWGKTSEGAAKFDNLLGSLDTRKITEQEARKIDHKWSPVRHYRKDIRAVGFEGDSLRIYARIFARDLYFYEYMKSSEVPEMNTVFVLSLGTGDESDDVYNELRGQLDGFVETAVIETDIEVGNEGS